jgi:hypothetical protein
MAVAAAAAVPYLPGTMMLRILPGTNITFLISLPCNQKQKQQTAAHIARICSINAFTKAASQDLQRLSCHQSLSYHCLTLLV